MRPRPRDALLGLLLLGAAGCQAAAPSPTRAPLASSAAAEAWADDALDVARFIAEGQRLYLQERSPRGAAELKHGGIELIDRGELRLGIREMMKALYRSEEVKDYLLAAECARWLALGYSFAGRFEHAVFWADQALAYLKPVNTARRRDQVRSVVTPALKVKGDAALRLGRTEAAIEYYEAALAESQPGSRPWVLSALANAEMRRKNFARAATLLAQADGGAHPSLKPLIKRGQGQLLLAEGRVDEAIAHFEVALKIAQAVRDDYETMWAEHGIARARVAQGEPAKAAAAYRRAIQVGDRLRGQFRSEEYRSGFYADVQTIFDEAVDALFAAGDVTEALEASEQSRARSLLDMVRGRVKLAEGGSTFVDGVGTPATAAAVRAALPADVAVVVYHTLADRTLAWVIRGDGVSGTSLPRGRDALDADVRALRRAIVARAPDAQALARRLGDVLLEPLGLRDGERVVFVPHHALHYLPFGALRGPSGWLLEAHAVATAPSASALLAIVQRPRLGATGVLALGNPDVGEARLALPGAEREVQNIHAVYPEAQVFTRREATKVRFVTLAPANTLVHVAAHATVDDIDPLYSTIRLAASGDQRGDLEAHEVYGLRLDRTRLVVLSACDTGMGRVAKGDEFLGFERVFLGSGARTLVITLWPIADVSTERLMTAFYRELRSAPIGEALRSAQLELARSAPYAEPVFWAGFSVVGDWR